MKPPRPGRNRPSRSPDVQNRQPRQPRQTPPLTAGTLSRVAAADILQTVIEERITLDDALTKSSVFGALAGADRGFARAMASGALRELGRIDAGLEPFLERPLETALPGARALLRIGAVQLWRLGTPDHAAVTETVAAAAHVANTGQASGFLNAVLRKAAADRSAFDAAAFTSIWPDWLRGTLVDSLGQAGAERFARVAAAEPALDLATCPGEAAHWAERLSGDVLGPSTLRLTGAGSIEALDGFDEGRWWVQDLAAQVPVTLLGDVAGRDVLDLCAAPGGKTMQLAAAGAQVTAVDRSAPRNRRLKANLKRCGLADRVRIETENLDVWEPGRTWPVILLDAPCSALGTLRRHPEGAWIKDPSDVARFPDVQARLLKRALDWLTPGGVLVYCVCSPVRGEGVDVVDRVIAETGARRLPVQALPEPGQARWLTAAGDVLSVPDLDVVNGQHDAFYMARLSRD